MPLPFLIAGFAAAAATVGTAGAAAAATVGAAGAAAAATVGAAGAAAAATVGAVGTAAGAVGAAAVGTAAGAVGAVGGATAGAIGAAGTLASGAGLSAAAGVLGTAAEIAAADTVLTGTATIVAGASAIHNNMEKNRIAEENHRKGYNKASKVYEKKMFDQAKEFEEQKERIINESKSSVEKKNEFIEDCLAYIAELEKEIKSYKENSQEVPYDLIESLTKLNLMKLELQVA